MLRLGIGAGIVLMLVLGIFLLGDKYGRNARTLAKYNAEIAKTNKKLQDFESKEKRRQIAEEDRAAAQDTVFVTELPRLDKCLLTPAQAAALNRIGGVE
jgi:hypothetical protein